MEIGNQTLDEVKKRIQPGDLRIHVKAGIVVQGNMGSLIAMRDSIESYMDSIGGELIYFSVTGQPLYLVHWNDLSSSKQKALEKKENR